MKDSWPGMVRTLVVRLSLALIPACLSLVPQHLQSRTCFGDHERFLNTYMRTYPGYYFTGDGSLRDKDGFYWITGRVDGGCGARVSDSGLGNGLIRRSLACACVQM